MASETNNPEEKQMATDVMVPGADEPDEQKPRACAEKPTASTGGFFTIYKHGQGYWTRLCTALAAALILIMTANFLWQNLPPYLIPALTPPNATTAQMTIANANGRHITMGICAAVLVLGALLLWRIINKPTTADFLIATDSEMKKVNWTSKKELVGSTKIVIFFMVVIALLLFCVDIFFGYLFYFLGVLKSPPL